MDESLTNPDKSSHKSAPVNPDEIISLQESKDILAITENDTMEVHKHPHHVTHKKKWTEYLLEFFMIFLAVFLGFLAETEREHIVEKNREKQFMSSLVRDLELDTMELAKGHEYRQIKIRAIDSAMKILWIQNRSEASSLLYGLCVRYYGNRNFFQNSGTLDQLKNSGGLRLIGNRMIVDSIESYDQQVKRMTTRDDFESDAFRYGNRIGQKLFDARSVVKVFGLSDNQIFHGDSSVMIKLNRAYLDEYMNNLRNYEYLIKSNDAVFELNKQKATNLLEFIKKEYHF